MERTLFDVAHRGPFFVFTRNDRHLDRFQYKAGLNTDPKPWNPYWERDSGFRFFSVDQLAKEPMIFSYMPWVRRVTLCNDTSIWEEDSCFRANKFILGERTYFEGLCPEDIQDQGPFYLVTDLTDKEYGRAYPDVSRRSRKIRLDMEHFFSAERLSGETILSFLAIPICSARQLCELLENGRKFRFIRHVTFPDDARIWFADNTFKATAVEIGGRRLFYELPVDALSARILSDMKDSKAWSAPDLFFAAGLSYYYPVAVDGRAWWDKFKDRELVFRCKLPPAYGLCQSDVQSVQTHLRRAMPELTFDDNQPKDEIWCCMKTRVWAEHKLAPYVDALHNFLQTTAVDWVADETKTNQPQFTRKLYRNGLPVPGPRFRDCFQEIVLKRWPIDIRVDLNVRWCFVMSVQWSDRQRFWNTFPLQRNIMQRLVHTKSGAVHETSTP